MYKEDGLSRRDVQSLVDSFSGQALDFFGAVRAATYDGQIRDWMASVAGQTKPGLEQLTQFTAFVVLSDALALLDEVSVPFSTHSHSRFSHSPK